MSEEGHSDESKLILKMQVQDMLTVILQDKGMKSQVIPTHMLSQILWSMDLLLSRDEIADLSSVLDPSHIGSFHQSALVQTLVVLMTLFDKRELTRALNSVDLDRDGMLDI